MNVLSYRNHLFGSFQKNKGAAVEQDAQCSQHSHILAEIQANRQVLLVVVWGGRVGKDTVVVLVDKQHVQPVAEGWDVLQPCDPIGNGVQLVVHPTEHHQRKQQDRRHTACLLHVLEERPSEEANTVSHQSHYRHSQG